MLFSDRLFARNRRFKIPNFIRAALGLHGESQLFGVAFNDEDAGILEINLTPIPRHAWQDTWRLEATIANNRGALSRLTQELAVRQIDIIRSRGVTIHRGTTFQLDLHLNLSRYQAELDGNPEQRKANPLRPIPELRAEIILCLLDDIELVTPDKPMLSLRRNLALHRAYNRDRDFYECTLRRRGVLDWDETLRAKIRQAFNKDLEDVPYYVVADEDNIVVRLFLLTKRSPLIHFYVEIQDSVGALGRIASALSDAGFNIYQVFARGGRHTGSCFLDMVVRFDNLDDSPDAHMVMRSLLNTCIAGAAGSVCTPVIVELAPISREGPSADSRVS